MSSLLPHWCSRLLSRLLSMGCVLLRPALTVEGVRYRPLRQLAEGGFSTIHLARDTHSGRKVRVMISVAKPYLVHFGSDSGSGSSLDEKENILNAILFLCSNIPN